MMDKQAPTRAPNSGSVELALRFISGKYQGGEFPLGRGQEIVIGRSSDLDMVLVEELVSRRHAKIVFQGNTITIEDLGSTNGTFVNGEKVQREVLHEGDRILIGTSILKVVASGSPLAEGQSVEAAHAARAAARQRMSRASDEPPRMSGNLEEIPLPDLLQLFGTSRKSGVLVLRGERAEGRITLQDGLIRSAEIEGASSVGAQKAVFRMLDWRRGAFDLDPPPASEATYPIEVSAQEILMEGFRQKDELDSLRSKLPAPDACFALASPLKPQLRDLTPEDLDVLQLALDSPTQQDVLNRSPSTDLETAKRLEGLLRRGYLVVT